jgi:hypothetical protein
LYTRVLEKFAGSVFRVEVHRTGTLMVYIGEGGGSGQTDWLIRTIRGGVEMELSLENTITGQSHQKGRLGKKKEKTQPLYSFQERNIRSR